jgi:hypothetical protein
MTKQEAKALSLEVWRWLAKHPEILYKSQLPERLYRKIACLQFRCPLCEVFLECTSCPLNVCNPNNSCADGAYAAWTYADSDERREAAAQKIVGLIEAWDLRRKNA